MKVSMMRSSMNPVKQEALERMLAEYQKEYDIILGNAGGDMKAVHLQVEDMIVRLSEKYKEDIEIKVELPANGKQWAALNKEHGVISVGTHITTGKVALIIMDEEDSGIAF